MASTKAFTSQVAALAPDVLEALGDVLEQRVTLRRRFRAQGRRLLDIADEALDGSTLDGASVGDFLLEELDRSEAAWLATAIARSRATASSRASSTSACRSAAMPIR